MSDSETRNLAELKRDIEERISRIEKDLANLKLSLKLVDEALAKNSFKPASRLLERPEPLPEQVFYQPTQKLGPLPVEEPKIQKEVKATVSAAVPIATKVEEEPQEQSFPIKSKLGEDLGTLYVGRNYVRITPRSDLAFSIKTPPFQSFFIDRVIGEMRRKDEMAVDAGAKDPSTIIAYDVKLDGDTIREILIRNLEEEARIRELRSSIRWTLERMMEKIPRR